MARFTKCFLNGIGKTLDIGNGFSIYEVNKRRENNISKSWKRVGSAFKKTMDIDIESEGNRIGRWKSTA